ncbi:PucR-like helix-turn-helix protein [Pseudonocardia cypriaca]|uniref:PucR-like helix-turn-helix protein n=1 Tax=Pseudonocardia cypriaca TaxID=882449 RepID=A0A543GEC8_9PSEU|nr:PucR-like helix-turn-helix protein [Pseudonocardia cypriaca]
MLPRVTDDGARASSGLSPATLRKLELAAGDLAAACLAAMARRQPWFARLSADLRAGVQLVTQTGVANFVAWIGKRWAEGSSGVPQLTAEAFRIAPRDLARRLTLSQTVDLVRIATEVFEEQLPPLAADEAERRTLVEGVLRFGREIAFAAATVYAGEAESRGAWDARVEALVVDAVVRGPGAESGNTARSWVDGLVSRASALGWDPTEPLRVVVGSPAPEAHEELLSELRREADSSGQSVLVGVQGNRLVVLLSEPPGLDTGGDIGTVVEAFGAGPVVVGPRAADLPGAHASARDALAGLRAAPARPDAPRPVAADDLLPERALAGDPVAHRRLVATAVEPLSAAGGELLTTLEAFLESGSALEACARALFVHPNTVRYRLRRVTELTGLRPADPRDALVLRFGVLAARLGPLDGS